MLSPPNFSQRTKILVIALSIFLVSLSLGMLVFGSDHELFDNLSTDSLHHGAEMIHLAP